MKPISLETADSMTWHKYLPFFGLIALVFNPMLPSCSAQMQVPQVEKAVMVEDENPLDTVEVFKGTLGLNLSQTALENWAGGGESSVAFTALCNLSETRERGPRSAGWGVDAALGLLRQQGGWRKTDDRLIVTGQWNTAMQTALRDARERRGLINAFFFQPLL